MGKPTEEAPSGEPALVVRRKDNLRPEGEFVQKSTKEAPMGERAISTKRPDNLAVEGDFMDGREHTKARTDEKANIVKHPDQGTKGKFSERLKEEAPVGERPVHLRPKDNLYPEGKFEGRTSGSAAPRGNNDANYGIPDDTAILDMLPGNLA